MQLSLEALAGFAAVIVTVLMADKKRGEQISSQIGALQAALTEIKEAFTNRVSALEEEVQWLRSQVVELLKGHARE